MCDSDANCKKKLLCNYRLLNENHENGEEEFSFEELRALQYFPMYQRRSKREQEMENEIAGLKKQLAVMQEKIQTTSHVAAAAKLVESKRANCDLTIDHHKMVSDYTANDFTNVSLMTTFKKTSDKNETDDYTTTNWLPNMTKPNITVFPTPNNVTMHTKKARQDVNALFGSTSVDTTVNSTMPGYNYDAKSIAIHNDFENSNSNGKESTDHFSIFHDPTTSLSNKENNAKVYEDGSIFCYENSEDKNQNKRKAGQPSIMKPRKPLTSIEETEARWAKINDENQNQLFNENSNDTDSIESKFSGLNDQYTAKLCFNPAAASTGSVKPFLDQLKKVKFNEEPDEFSICQDLTLTTETNSADPISKIMEEDFKTEYISKLMTKQHEAQKSESTKKTILKVVSNDETASSQTATVTTNYAEFLTWDSYDMVIRKEAQTEKHEQDFTEYIQPLEFNTQRVSMPSSRVNDEEDKMIDDETFNDLKYKCITEKNNYQICANISSANTSENVTQSISVIKQSVAVEKSYLIEQHQQSQHHKMDNTHMTFNQSKLVPSNLSNLTANSTLPDLALPPDFTKSYLAQNQTNNQSMGVSRVDQSMKQNEDQKAEYLTRDGCDETMTIAINKLYKVIDAAAGGALMNCSVQQIMGNDASTLEGFNEQPTKTLPVLWKYLPNFTANSANGGFDEMTGFTTTLKTVNLMNINENSSDSNRSQSPNNETIIQAIKDPFDHELKNRLLARHQDAFNKYTNYRNLDAKLPSTGPGRPVTFEGESFKISKEVGHGAYAKIYIIDSYKNSQKRLALKVSQQPTAWEYYITETLHERLKSLKRSINVDSSFIRINSFIQYQDGILCNMTYYKNGTLLDLINYHIRNNCTMPYWFVIYLTLEMLNIVNYLHKSKIIHGDIKPDNLMVSEIPKTLNYFDPSRTKCLVLIDFNRSIDLEMYPDETEFDAKASNKSLLCCEMKSEKTWTFQIDHYGLLQAIHCLIFKKYLTTYIENERFRINSTFPRSYDRLFQSLFDTFLNIPSCKTIPDLETEWIPQFVNLFRNELVANFSKSEKYLNDLNAEYGQR